MNELGRTFVQKYQVTFLTIFTYNCITYHAKRLFDIFTVASDSQFVQGTKIKRFLNDSYDQTISCQIACKLVLIQSHGNNK